MLGESDMSDLFEPHRDDAMISYDDHVDDIVQCLLAAPDDLLPRLLERVRERVNGEMCVEVFERWKAARGAT